MHAAGGGPRRYLEYFPARCFRDGSGRNLAGSRCTDQDTKTLTTMKLMLGVYLVFWWLQS